MKLHGVLQVPLDGIQVQVTAVAFSNRFPALLYIFVWRGVLWRIVSRQRTSSDGRTQDLFQLAFLFKVKTFIYII